MPLKTTLSRLFAGIAMIPLVGPPSGLANAWAEDQPISPKDFSPVSWGRRVPLVDVVLSPHKTLVGRVLAADGLPQPARVVTASLNSKTVGKVTTDAVGNFAIPVRNGGIYLVSDRKSTRLNSSHRT